MSHDDQRSSGGVPSVATVAMDRARLEVARRHMGLQEPGPGADAAPWTACRAPNQVLVIDRAGGLRPCEHGSIPLEGPAAPLSAWQAGAFAALRADLARGQLPCEHCRRCIDWLADDLFPTAPPLQDYGALPAAPAATPGLVVVHLPADGSPPRVDLLAELAAVLPDCHTLVIDEPVLGQGAFGRELLAALPPGDRRPRLRLRGAALAADAAATFGGLPIDSIELQITTAAPEPLRAAMTVARALGASLVARFVLQPGNWFDLEEAARTTAALGIPLQPQLADRFGRVPLAAVDAESLDSVRRVLVESWPRLGSKEAPTSLASGAFDALIQATRLLVRRVVEAGQDGTGESLSLPGLDHPWTRDPARRAWWFGHLFGLAHTAAVQRWLRAELASPQAAQRLARTPWLRALAHREALYLSSPRAYELLRQLYTPLKSRTSLLESDRAFAAQFDLRPFGGPWFAGLGLELAAKRKRPFPIGAPRVATPGTEPDLTVLIPSYGHEQFIAETLRSVLAQSYPEIRILVVDDCSADATVARAEAVEDPRLEVRRNDTNLGLGNSVLAALATVTTPFLAVLNSDDLLHPEHLARCRRVLVEDPSAVLVATDLHLIDHAGGSLEAGATSPVLDGHQVHDWVRWYEGMRPATAVPRAEQFAALLERNYLITSSNLVTRTDWLRAQTESLRSLKYCLDWQLFLEAARGGGLVHLPERLLAYRLHSSNTVWFQGGRRYRYYLEVNRVAAGALRAFAAQGGGAGDERIESVLAAVAEHVVRNGETDGYALFLNAALDALQLDRLAQESPRAKELLERLQGEVARLRRADPAPAPAPDLRDRLLGQLGREQAWVEREQRRWLQVHADGIERRLQHQDETRQREQAEHQELVRHHGELEQRRRSIEAEVTRLSTRTVELEGRERELQQALAGTRGDLTGARDELQASRGELQASRTELQATRGELEATRAELQATRSELQATRAELQETRSELQATRAELQETRSELQATRDELASTRRQLAAAIEQLQSSQREMTAAIGELRTTLQTELDSTRGERDVARGELQAQAHALQLRAQELQQQQEAIATLQAELARTRADVLAGTERATGLTSRLSTAAAELQRSQAAAAQQAQELQDRLQTLQTSKAYRTGDLIWNRCGLAYLSRRLKKWYRRALDLKLRLGLRLRGSSAPEGTAITAAVRHWPTWSNTFCYEEMVRLAEVGFEVRLCHWDHGDRGVQHAAYRSLDRRRLHLQTVQEIQVRDRAHFERSRPVEFERFLGRLAAAVKIPAAQLREHPLVLQGCTFARAAELAHATYLHSYFFYDMSFMTMQAACLLGLPRGISCYADHMLDDYPFKVVTMQLEAADLVVATSERVRTELMAKVDAAHHGKILVKPNGVDGSAFPPPAERRRAAGAPLELISVSRLEAKKGLEHLIDAIAVVKAHGVSVRVHVVGAADHHSPGSVAYAQQLRQRIERAGLQAQFELHGARTRDQLLPLLQRSHAFVAPYVELPNGDKDGIPTAMLEAMACGLPVLSTDAGSIPEVSAPETERLQVPQRDAAALAAAIERLAGDEELLQRLGAASRRVFAARFDAAVTERALHERIREVRRRRHGTPPTAANPVG